MDGTAVAALARVIDDHANRRIDSEAAKSRISAILHRKSAKRVLGELDGYAASLPGKERGKAVLIVIMALLRLDLDSGDALAKEIQTREYPLAGPLCGGLKMLLGGKSETFAFRLTRMYQNGKNAYAAIDHWDSDYYWNYIEMFLAVELLHKLQPSRFEQLALEDPNRIILLSMAHGHMRIDPSDALLQKLLSSTDPFHPNFALAFYTLHISILCDKAWRGDANRRDIRRLKEDIDRCLTALGVCSAELRGELLTNYLLVHHWAFPEAFARLLVGEELQAEFAKQITQPGKVRSIRELAFVAKLVTETPACNQQKCRISKKPLADAVLCVLMGFVRDRTGIYVGDERWLDDAKTVLRLLTVQQRRRFGRFLESQDSALMVGRLDQLVRFDLYLEDRWKHETIRGLQSCLASSTGA